jgi:soluble lytic murein transglycosylase-like protein
VTTQQIQTLIDAAANKYGISPTLLQAVAQKESGYDANAVSSAGALGVMQLMPGTDRDMGVTDPFDPAQNIDAGAKYLAQQLHTFGGDAALALAAYDAGPGTVQKYNGIPPFAETQDYVSSILAQVGLSETGQFSSSGDSAAMVSISGGPEINLSSLPTLTWLVAGTGALALLWAYTR